MKRLTSREKEAAKRYERMRIAALETGKALGAMLVIPAPSEYKEPTPATNDANRPDKGTTA